MTPGNRVSARLAALISRSDTAIFCSPCSLSIRRKAVRLVVSTESVKYRWGAVNLLWDRRSPMIFRTPL